MNKFFKKIKSYFSKPTAEYEEPIEDNLIGFFYTVDESLKVASGIADLLGEDFSNDNYLKLNSVVKNTLNLYDHLLEYNSGIVLEDVSDRFSRTAYNLVIHACDDLTKFYNSVDEDKINISSARIDVIKVKHEISKISKKFESLDEHFLQPWYRRDHIEPVPIISIRKAEHRFYKLSRGI